MATLPPSLEHVRFTHPFILTSYRTSSIDPPYSSASSPSRRLPQAPPRRSIPALQPRQCTVAARNQRQGYHLTQVRIHTHMASHTQFPLTLTNIHSIDLIRLAPNLKPSLSAPRASRLAPTPWGSYQLTLPSTGGFQSLYRQKPMTMTLNYHQKMATNNTNATVNH